MWGLVAFGETVGPPDSHLRCKSIAAREKQSSLKVYPRESAESMHSSKAIHLI